MHRKRARARRPALVPVSGVRIPYGLVRPRSHPIPVGSVLTSPRPIRPGSAAPRQSLRLFLLQSVNPSVSITTSQSSCLFIPLGQRFRVLTRSACLVSYVSTPLCRWFLLCPVLPGFLFLPRLPPQFAGIPFVTPLSRRSWSSHLGPASPSMPASCTSPSVGRIQWMTSTVDDVY